MSAAAISAIVVTLWPKLRSIMLQLGRWVLDRWSRKGLSRLRYYIDDKIDDFQRRLARVITRRGKLGARFKMENWRVQWLRSRIVRWKLALRWLEGPQAERLRGKAIDFAKARAEREIPEHAPDDDFKKWLKRRKAS